MALDVSILIPPGDNISLQSLFTKPSGATRIVITSKHTPQKNWKSKLLIRHRPKNIQC